MPAKSWSLVWPLVSNPCQCSYIAWDVVCCSCQMVRESWSPDCHWREGSSSGTRVWIRSYPCTWRIRHWCSLETLCWILLWGQASWDLLYTLIVYFKVSHSMTLVTSVVEPDLLSSWLLHWVSMDMWLRQHLYQTTQRYISCHCKNPKFQNTGEPPPPRLSMGNMLQELPQLGETADNTKCYL